MSTTTTTDTRTKGAGRGFKSLSPERRREIASLGGRRAHEMGLAHKWNKKTAAEAGRKGGSISRRGKATKV